MGGPGREGGPGKGGEPRVGRGLEVGEDLGFSRSYLYYDWCLSTLHDV